ncbi:hypothetical protein [Bartonella sp. B39]
MVSEVDTEEIESDVQGSRAYDTVIYGQNGMLWLQNVYRNGTVFNTKIMRGGVQNFNGTENFNNGFTKDDGVDDGDFILNEIASALRTEFLKMVCKTSMQEGMRVILLYITTPLRRYVILDMRMI